MADLVAFVSSGKGTIPHVNKIVEEGEWETIYILTSKEFQNEIINRQNIKKILIDTNKHLQDLVSDIKRDLKDIRVMDTAVNIISGDGKEHMALLCALLQLGVGIRFVAYTRDGVKEI